MVHEALIELLSRLTWCWRLPEGVALLCARSLSGESISMLKGSVRLCLLEELVEWV